MTAEDTQIPGPLNNVIRIDDERIKGHLDRVVRGTAEETLNALLDAEADRMRNAERYERTEARRDRKKVEMLFAHLKRILRLGRLRLRGPRGAQFEFTFAAIAQNLRRLAKLTVHPPDRTAMCVA